MKKKAKPPAKQLLPDPDAQVLKDTTIDENGPGTILRDFHTLLDFIGPGGIGVSGKQGLIPLKALPLLNSRMSHPIETRLSRPQQKSYFHIDGLYLLLRLTGIGLIEGSGSKQTLSLNKAILDSWLSLNPTERYFTLLETWLLRGGQGIGAQRSFLGSIPPIITCGRFLGEIPDKGLKIAEDKEAERSIRYAADLLTIALLQLFGLIVVKYAKTEEGKGWSIAEVRRTPFGSALMQLLLNDALYAPELLSVFLVGEEEDIQFGELQPLLQPFFPDWQKNLSLPKLEFQEGTYIFKVSLGRAWRRVAIPGTSTMSRLADIILDAFDFDSDHLYSFTYRNPFGRESVVNHPYMEEPPSADDVNLGDLHIKAGSSMIFLYDFGDDWEFTVKLEKIDQIDPNMKHPTILETHGKAPDQYSDWE